MAEQKETKNPVQSAERIFQVLEMLAEHGEMGLMEISQTVSCYQTDLEIQKNVYRSSKRSRNYMTARYLSLQSV